MNLYTFTHTSEYDGKKYTCECTSNAEGLDDLIEDFKCFLKGCTFSEELVDQIQRDADEDDENYN